MFGEQGHQKQGDLAQSAAQLGFEHIHHHLLSLQCPVFIGSKANNAHCSATSERSVSNTYSHAADSFSQEALLAHFSHMKN